MPIYTKTGDKGETSLFGGKRVSKSHDLVDVYGSIDELNSWVGLVASQITDEDTRNFLQDVQSDLFTIGGVLAGWGGDVHQLAVCAEDMEVWIDTMEEKLPELNNFILPGGTTIAAYTHITRSVCRRVERRVVSFYQLQPTDFHLSPPQMEAIIKYINRLSDLFFQLARFINSDAGVADVDWFRIPRRRINK